MPQSSIQRSLDYAQGHVLFKALHFKQHEQEFARLAADGQDPKAMLIACSDSRVVPDLIMSTKPGELFVVRTAGNFVPIYDLSIGDGVSASLEFAVKELKITDIIVCGHSHCGAIKGLFQESPLSENMKKWLRFGEKACQMAKKSLPNSSTEELYRVAEHLSVIYQLEHLMTYPFIKEKVDKEELFLHGWYIFIESGDIFYYDPQKYHYYPLREILTK